MRLINAKTLRLVEFLDGQAPSYAILSHTWGDEAEEISFRNVEEGNIDKPVIGSVKFRGCCRQAREEGLDYVWIDTCCINKNDLVELSEAINSMFRWYRNASVCYACLTDVPADDEPREELSRFRASRWFQRGWTLQELLAPKHLVFYTSDWHLLGTKTQLSYVIENITGISRLFLRGINDIQTASVAQRMSWAANRDTRRKEDLAYCLLGIFDIAMPMIYGEGGNQAFFRLQEQIMKSTKDHSILAWGLGEGISSARGILAATPSDFANSGDIIPRDQSFFNSLEISSGSLRISLPILTTDTGITGLLNCGPEKNTQQVVGIPLLKVASGGPDEYIRPKGKHSVLRPIPALDTPHKFIYIKNDNGTSTQSSSRHYWMYENSDFIDVDIQILEVAPPSSWDEDRAFFTSTGESDPTLVRLRQKKQTLYDFILILELKPSGIHLEADHCVMICSRDTPLSLLARKLNSVIPNASGNKSASNGLLELRLKTQPITRRPVCDIRPEVTPYQPGVTFDATAGLLKSHLSLAVEAELFVRRRSEELHSIDYCERSHELKSVFGQPPLLWASENGETDIVKLLLNNSIVVAAINNGSRTPLIAASDKGHTDVVRLLLDTGKTNVDLKDSESGRTSLAWAAERGHEIIAQLLLEEGADIEAKDKASRTAISYAAERRHTAIVQLLFGHGAAILSDEITAWQLQQTLEGHRDGVLSVTFSHNSKLVASASKDRTVRLWDTKTGLLQQTLGGHRDSVSSVAFSHRSELLASASWKSHTIRLWDTATGRLRQILNGHSDGIWSVTFSRDSKLLASASMDHTIRLWNPATGQVQQTLQGHKRGIWSVTFSHNSKLLASASADRTVRLCSTSTGHQQILHGHRDEVWFVAFSHDSRLLVSASKDRTIRLWDITTRRLQHILTGHRDDINAVTFSHNSKLLASTSVDRTIRLWDTTTGELLYTLWGHNGSIWSVAFSHDSKLLASASEDRTIRLWDIATGRLYQTLWGHKNAVRLVTFSHDSRLLASASMDHDVRLWESC